MAKVTLRGQANCFFVRVMEVPDDEAAELLAGDESLIECNLDHPDAIYTIEDWSELSAM